MSDEKALTPVLQKQVLFYDDMITAVQLQDNTVYIPLRPLCDLLGLDWSSQRRRINRDPVLGEEVRAVAVTTTARSDDRPQTVPMLCLPLEFVSGFLFGISVSRVKEELQSQLIRYQRECYKVLHEAFQDGRLTSDVDFDSLLVQADGEAVQAYQIALAVVKLARNQIMMQAELKATQQQLAVQSETIAGNTGRIEQIEALLGNEDRYVTEAQASRISQAVKAVAMALSEQTKRNEFGGVYGELYRRFEITSYKQLPAKRFEEAIKFLTDWHQSLVGDVPF